MDDNKHERRPTVKRASARGKDAIANDIQAQRQCVRRGGGTKNRIRAGRWITCAEKRSKKCDSKVPDIIKHVSVSFFIFISFFYFFSVMIK